MSESFLKEFEEKTGENLKDVLKYICAVANSLFYSKEYERKVFVEILHKKTDSKLIELLIRGYDIKKTATQETNFCTIGNNGFVKCFNNSPVVECGLGFKDDKTKSFFYFVIQNVKEVKTPYHIIVFPEKEKFPDIKFKYHYTNIYDYQFDCYYRDYAQNYFHITNDKEKNYTDAQHNRTAVCIKLKNIKNYTKVEPKKTKDLTELIVENIVENIIKEDLSNWTFKTKQHFE